MRSRGVPAIQRILQLVRRQMKFDLNKSSALKFNKSAPPEIRLMLQLKWLKFMSERGDELVDSVMKLSRADIVESADGIQQHHS
jgi:hypothetical protein